MAVIVAVAVNTDGRREILGITVMPSEAETFWADFLRSLTRRGLRGVQLVISDAHEGLKAAARKVLGAGWQRCRVHFQRNLLARVGKANNPAVSAVVKTVFAEKDRDQAHARWREVADSLRERFRDVAELIDEAEHDVLAYMTFDETLRAKLHSTNPLERANEPDHSLAVREYPDHVGAALDLLVDALQRIGAVKLGAQGLIKGHVGQHV